MKEIAQPPWVLYIKGMSPSFPTACLAVVGTRQPTNYGRRVARKMAAEIASRGWVVVSGMAAGIDSEAHRGALEADGKTVAVLGTGVDVVYPRHLRSLYAELVEKGAVCSEMPPGTAPHPGLFPRRNRIISGLSVGTLVVEAAERSGALITADFSMEQGREVFAVPGPVTSEKSAGTNRLIQQGAKCVTGVQDILEEFPSLVPTFRPGRIDGTFRPFSGGAAVAFLHRRRTGAHRRIEEPDLPPARGASPAPPFAPVEKADPATCRGRGLSGKDESRRFTGVSGE